MPKRLKKLSEEILHENPWWKYKHDTYEKPNGETGDYYYCETRGMAMIVPIMPDGRIALTLQHRYLADKQSIEFPGGSLGEHEEVMDAARTELLEETGLIADEFIKIGEFEPNGLVKDRSHIFIAHVSEQTQQKPDDTEEIEVLFRQPHEVDQMVCRNEIWDGQSLAAWALAHHTILKDHQK